MSKFFQALLTGVFFTFILDFFIFLGVKQNYIDFHNIDLYYNVLFADHQNIYVYSIFSIFIGYLVIYLDNNKISAVALGILFSIVSLTLLPSVGKAVGELMFTRKNVTLNDSKHSYIGDVYYDGRKKITFFDYELNKVIILEKERLKEKTK